ncbi:superoxide dismutase family protein [Aestuariivivens sediminicola]|uniref:superoxide dismutase family protein n=1 Tax=Aestuariivivens sediminicola TaxID=2913560 RepID=UPI001F5708D3|nr:superoxide dismutase family protein [Aestuariivivens sediminicola]
MKKTRFLVATLALIGMMSCKNEKKEPVDSEETKVEVSLETVVKEVKKLTINLEPKSDSKVNGQVTFKEEDGVVTMTAIMSDLEPGVHAIHLHQTADCSSADGKSTGGHWNPTAQPHGKWGDEAGYHKGDIGNFTADENGNGLIQFSTDEWCIGCDDENKNILGKAVIVHAGADDLTSQPSGAAGARISCAGIIE